MGIDDDFGWAFAKSQAGAGAILPKMGVAFVSVKESDRPQAFEVAQQLLKLGFRLQGTSGTAAYLHDRGVAVETVNKVAEGRPNIVDHIKNGEIALVVNTVRTAASHARAAAMGIEAILKKELSIRSLQEYHRT